MATTKAQQKAVNRYISKTYDRVNLVLKKAESPTKEQVQSAADAAGESLNAYIVGAVAQRIERESSPAGCAEMPNDESLEAIRETNEKIKNGTSKPFKGSTEEFFKMLLDDEEAG